MRPSKLLRRSVALVQRKILTADSSIIMAWPPHVADQQVRRPHDLTIRGRARRRSEVGLRGVTHFDTTAENWIGLVESRNHDWIAINRGGSAGQGSERALSRPVQA